ncbi:CDK-activating kinase assembly factor MAT1-domain-containing protein [Microdochium trichocladiopsis]|uniref:RNA polymerase II transcription factor B subunit 3 n=1 Tax=Microdochium trichocladiopsis TaxID=1682393 RepID=A0A9P8YCT2_9PEZI|nr:CDK-activating kinase assembly factor MAT1-domain-containing protein [Microdochium trichocladiopsis]KAH7034683.1 CDK-activating kinase assembly factor MAT1-domain-containing protein [Microdochium trichocladiopsis]
MTSRRLPGGGVSTTVFRPSGGTPAGVGGKRNEVPDELCPICKRSKYLNPDMEFQINPECYHPMCSNCVVNIFKSGPTQCPHAGCNKTLRQRGFRTPWYKDLEVEREVDIRKRVNAVFNMVQDDFETLRDWNDYLQNVEDLTFNLIQGDEAERAKAETELAAYEKKHREEIELNKKKGKEAEQLRKKRDADAAEASRLRRLEERDEELRAKAEEAKIGDEVMEALARGEPGTAAEIQARIVARKKAQVAKISGSHYASLLDGGGLSIRGLKAKGRKPYDDDEDDEDESKPYDPFGGLRAEPARYVLHDSYEFPHLDDARHNDNHRVPGYSVHEFYARAMFEAFAGLGVNIGDEKANDLRALGTAGAEAAAQSNETLETAMKAAGSNGSSNRMQVDDVFG